MSAEILWRQDFIVALVVVGLYGVFLFLVRSFHRHLHQLDDAKLRRTSEEPKE